MDEVVTSVRRAGVLCTTHSTPMTDPTSPSTTPVNCEHPEERTNIEQLQSGRLEVTATEGDVGGCGRMGARLPVKQAVPENSASNAMELSGTAGTACRERWREPEGWVDSWADGAGAKSVISGVECVFTTRPRWSDGVHQKRLRGNFVGVMRPSLVDLLETGSLEESSWERATSQEGGTSVFGWASGAYDSSRRTIVRGARSMCERHRLRRVHMSFPCTGTTSLHEAPLFHERVHCEGV